MFRCLFSQGVGQPKGDFSYRLGIFLNTIWCSKMEPIWN